MIKISHRSGQIIIFHQPRFPFSSSLGTPNLVKCKIRTNLWIRDRPCKPGVHASSCSSHLGWEKADGKERNGRPPALTMTGSSNGHNWSNHGNSPQMAFASWIQKPFQLSSAMHVKRCQSLQQLPKTDSLDPLPKQWSDDTSDLSNHVWVPHVQFAVEIWPTIDMCWPTDIHPLPRTPVRTAICKPPEPSDPMFCSPLESKCQNQIPVEGRGKKSWSRLLLS